MKSTNVRLVPLDQSGEHRLVEVPAWAGDAWQFAAQNPKLEDALNSYFEGLKLTTHHPSFAALAFFAALERLGHVLAEVKVTKSGDRVREALRLVLSGEDLELAELGMWEKRGATTHSGKLYGLEPWFGQWASLGGFVPDDPHSFHTERVPRLQRAVRKLLLGVFSGARTIASASNR
jgi:hypothetical protein